MGQHLANEAGLLVCASANKWARSPPRPLRTFLPPTLWSPTRTSFKEIYSILIKMIPYFIPT